MLLWFGTVYPWADCSAQYEVASSISGRWCRLAAYSGRKAGFGQRSCWPLNADPSGGSPVADRVQRQKDLDLSVDSEHVGEVLFKTTAKVMWSSERRAKWDTLAELESQTKSRLHEYLVASEQRGSAGRTPGLRGKTLGLLLALLPWRVSMNALAKGTARYLAAFRRLETSAESDLDRDFFEYLVAHEVAIRSFARAELEGDADRALASVLALLSEPNEQASESP
jgi:hypothetical protein